MPLKEQWSTFNSQQVKDELAQILTKAYETKETQVTAEVMRAHGAHDPFACH